MGLRPLFSMFVIVKEKAAHLCKAYRCKKRKDGRGRFCSKHYKRWRLEKDPVAYVYSATKSNAKRRGKEWGITLDEWREWCASNDYIEKRGKKKKSSSIDRIDNSQGYFLWNIQILPLGVNSSKSDKEWEEECGF